MKTEVEVAVEPVQPEFSHVRVVSSPSSPSSPSVPSYNWRTHWLTVIEFSRMMGRRPSTVYEWIGDGTLAEFGIPVCQFRHGRLHSGRTFIQNVL